MRDASPDDRLFSIAMSWQTVQQDESFAVVAVHFATEYDDKLTNTLGFIEKDSDLITSWGASYFPELTLTTVQAYVFDTLLRHIKDEYFSNTTYTDLIDRNTFHDLMSEIYTSLDDYLCDGAYLGELMQRFGVTQVDLETLCFMLRDLHCK